jgi:hypothetical protein
MALPTSPSVAEQLVARIATIEAKFRANCRHGCWTEVQADAARTTIASLAAGAPARLDVLAG